MGDWTKGPWQFEVRAYHQNRVFARANKAIADVIGDSPETDANAHLIAESPAMYAELAGLAEDLESMVASEPNAVHREWARDNLESVKAVLAKARGETQGEAG